MILYTKVTPVDLAPLLYAFVMIISRDKKKERITKKKCKKEEEKEREKR